MLNSSNSNIEEEFEQIKNKLKQLSEQNMAGKSMKGKTREVMEGGEFDDDQIGTHRNADKIQMNGHEHNESRQE